jgi:putative ABC transport system ATP-binding protein
VAAGLERPSAGRVLLFGRDLGSSDEDGRARLRRGRVSLVFQSFHLLPNMTAEENVAAPLEIARKPNAMARPAPGWTGWAVRRACGTIRTSCRAVSSSGWRWPGAGAQSRLAVRRRATGNLDGPNARHVADLLFELVEQTGAALLMVTHDRAWRPRAARGDLRDGRCTPTPGRRMSPPLWLRFAARELRSGVKGFRIFLACLALGVAAIAAASSTAEAFRQGLASQAREILGGDLPVSVPAAVQPIEREPGALGRTPIARGVAAMAEAPAASGGWWSSAASTRPIRWPAR